MLAGDIAATVRGMLIRYLTRWLEKKPATNQTKQGQRIGWRVITSDVGKQSACEGLAHDRQRAAFGSKLAMSVLGGGRLESPSPSGPGVLITGLMFRNGTWRATMSE